MFHHLKSKIFEVGAFCKLLVNMETKEVFDIEVVHNVDGLEVLDNESVVIDDVQYPVFRSDEAGPDDFFYN